MRFRTEIKSAIIISKCQNFHIHIKVIGFYFSFVSEMPLTFNVKFKSTHSYHHRGNMSNAVTIKMTSAKTWLSEYS